MIFHLEKESCSYCQKSVRLGMPHYECYCCNKIFHAKCYKPSKSELINDNLYCIDCKASIVRKYNPYKTMIDCSREDDIDPYLQKISDILEQCRSFSIKDFNTGMQPYVNNNCSMIFQNIDGNRTNFDAFSMDLERISQKFQIIGIAETNIGIDESTVYKLEGYNSYYQEKHVNKKKGKSF